MRIIIAGGRDFRNYDLLRGRVLKLMEATCYSSDSLDYTIVSGCADGTDRLGERFAKEYGTKLRTFRADWENLGRKAGPIRNAEMAKFAKKDNDYSMLIAFWDGNSKGTKNMIDEAYKNKLDEVHVYKY